jgi:hypothetical protein
MLWVGLWVGEGRRILWQSASSFSGNSFIRKDHSQAAVWKTAAQERALTRLEGYSRRNGEALWEFSSVRRVFPKRREMAHR